MRRDVPLGGAGTVTGDGVLNGPGSAAHRYALRGVRDKQIGGILTGRRRLIAMDADDLAVISAHVQDAEVRIADIVWRPSEKRLVVGMNRFDWEQSISGETTPRRLISALRFDRVMACKSRDIDLEGGDAALRLLGIEFNTGETPGGNALLLFDGRGALRLDVECLECELADLGPDDLSGDDEAGLEA